MRLASRNIGDVLVALGFVGFGAFVLLEAVDYEFGTPARMGPGFFPVGIGAFLVIIGLALVLEALQARKTKFDISMRAVLAIGSGLGAFAVLAGTAGLVPATVALVALSRLAEPTRSWLRVAGLALALSAIGYFIFHLGFRIPLNPFWW